MHSGYYAATTVRPSGPGVWSAGIEAQCLLKRRGHNPGTVDGIFGTNSQNAAKVFQRAMNSHITPAHR
jgi:peptidoglycan hydrolase-like protein with peptidoglycan-binding domain